MSTPAGSLDRRVFLLDPIRMPADALGQVKEFHSSAAAFAETVTRDAGAAPDPALAITLETLLQLEQRKVWASVEFTGGSESVVADQKTATTAARFRIRWISDLTERHRVRYAAKTYEIRSIQPEGRKSLLILNCDTRDHEALG